MLLTPDLIGRKFTGDASNYDFNDGDTRVTKVTDIYDTENRGGNDYVDVYINGYIAYMVGETCELVGFTDSEVTLSNENNETEHEEFTINKRHFDACFALSCV